MVAKGSSGIRTSSGPNTEPTTGHNNPVTLTEITSQENLNDNERLTKGEIHDHNLDEQKEILSNEERPAGSDLAPSRI